MNRLAITEKFQEHFPKILCKGRAKSYMPDFGNTADRVLEDIGLAEVLEEIRTQEQNFPIQKHPRFVREALAKIYREADELTRGKDGSLQTFARHRASRGPLPKFDGLSSVSFNKALIQSVVVQEEVRAIFDYEKTRLQKKARHLGQRIAENQLRLAQEETKRALLQEGIRKKIDRSAVLAHQENVAAVEKINKDKEMTATQTMWKIKQLRGAAPQDSYQPEPAETPKPQRALQEYIAHWHKRRDLSLSKSLVQLNRKLSQVRR